MHKRKLVQVKKSHDAGQRLQKQWEQILSNDGFSMNRGLSDRLSYAGTVSDLVVIEKYRDDSGGNQKVSNKTE